MQVPLPGIVGPSSRQRSRNVDVEELINWYMEQAGASPKAPWTLQPVPAVSPFVILGGDPVRGMFAEDGRLFAVIGPWFYEVFASQTGLVRGVVAVDANPATISSNGEIGGHQLFITSGGLGYTFDLDSLAFAQITDDAFPTQAKSGLFVDGYFMVLDAVTGKFLISSLEDGTTWNGLDFGAESQFSDKVVQFLKVNDTVWMFGTKNISPWYDSGAADFPFQPTSGTIIQHGLFGWFTPAVLANTPIWLGQDADGGGIIWMANGTTPQRVSTPAVEYDLRPRPEISLTQAIGYTFQWLGHNFYALYVRGRPWTWMFDVTTQQWWKWAIWDERALVWRPHVGRCHAFAYNRNLIGDRQSGTIYELRPDLGEDHLITSLGFLTE